MQQHYRLGPINKFHPFLCSNSLNVLKRNPLLIQNGEGRQDNMEVKLFHKNHSKFKFNDIALSTSSFTAFAQNVQNVGKSIKGWIHYLGTEKE